MLAIFYFPGLNPDMEQLNFTGIAKAIEYGKARCEAEGTKRFDLLWGKKMYPYFFHGHWYRSKSH